LLAAGERTPASLAAIAVVRRESCCKGVVYIAGRFLLFRVECTVVRGQARAIRVPTRYWTVRVETVQTVLLFSPRFTSFRPLGYGITPLRGYGGLRPFIYLS